MDKFNQLKTKLIIGGIALILLALIVWYAYNKGASKTVIAPLVKDNPNSNTPDNNPTAVPQQDIDALALNIMRDMSGFNGSGHDDTYYRLLLSYSDTDFERVYNAFNKLPDANGETLKGWISDQWGLYLSEFSYLQDSILQKMDRLKLI